MEEIAVVNSSGVGKLVNAQYTPNPVINTERKIFKTRDGVSGSGYSVSWPSDDLVSCIEARIGVDEEKGDAWLCDADGFVTSRLYASASAAAIRRALDARYSGV